MEATKLTGFITIELNEEHTDDASLDLLCVALPTKATDVSYIIGGGAFHVENKIVQHNGAGTVSISKFYANDFGKLYRSWGNYSTSYERHVIIDSVALIAGLTGNFGDTATLTNVCTSGKPSATNVCYRYEGTTPGNEPDKIGCGNVCNYVSTDVWTC
ncbi:hypothetical protein FRC04_002897 [Tulasnella sp. 424]|nr:hypothetical protein FRC04_002897 [Tulasnella sp. 424]